MNRHWKMDGPDARHRLDAMPQGLTGQPLDRPEGRLKVSGTATYAHEYQIADCAHGVLVRATVAKGRVTAIDVDAAKAMPGVLGVFTGDRFLRNPAQGGANEAPEQGADDVAYFGQPIALVVAEGFEQARHAAQSLRIDYAAAGDADFDPQTAATVDTPNKNQFDQGDLDAAMANAEVAIDVTYTTPSQNSAAMEPHASIAQWDDDKLTLYGSYQMPKYNRNELADSLGIDPGQVRILSPYVGGGFGSKLGIAPEAVAAALAARALGRPVKVAMTRPQVFEATMRRSETRQRIRLAADAGGVLSGLSHEALVSNLEGEEFSEPVAQATHFLYGGEHRRIVHEVARLNLTCAGSMRAPGETVGMLGLENAMDELADRLGLDPVELRKRNLADREPEKSVPYSSRKLAECLDVGAARFGWSERPQKPASRREGRWFVGYGMSVAARKNLLSESSARVTLAADGQVTVQTDMTDIGTGTYAILGQIAADMLGVPIDRVAVQLGDTRFPPGAGSGGSWGAASSSSSVLLACEEIRCVKLGCDPEALTLKDGAAIAGNRRQALAELIGPDGLMAEGTIEPGAVNLDVPQLDVVFLEERDDWANPLQAKGIGELGISGAGAAITNAIFNACGARVREYPATLDKIFPHLPD